MWVKLPGPFSSLYESTYQVFYKPENGAEGVVVFRADFENQPVIVICPSNDGKVFCFYDNGQGYRLIKIDTTKSFQGLSPQSPLTWIIRDSSFSVGQGKKEDWKTALEYLERMTPDSFKSQSAPVLNFGIQVHAFQKPLLQHLRDQADAIYGLYGGASTMPLFNDN